MKALVTGATGFIGRRLIAELEAPHVLSRSASRAAESLAEFDVSAFGWRAKAERPPEAALDGVDTVFHLAGESIADGRWTPDKKRRILDSRVLGTRHLVEAMAALDVGPRTLVSASAVGYYGSCGDRELTEDAAPGDDFAAEVSIKWEEAAQAATELGVRVVSVRLGVVLGPGGGALAKMLPPFKLGLGGRLGSGRQWMPWVHLDDVVACMLAAAADDRLVGPLNAVAPSPVRNGDFTKTLARALGRPAWMNVPEFALRATLGELADLVLASQRVVPKVALDAGVEFGYPTLESALDDILS